MTVKNSRKHHHQQQAKACLNTNLEDEFVCKKEFVCNQLAADDSDDDLFFSTVDEDRCDMEKPNTFIYATQPADMESLADFPPLPRAPRTSTDETGIDEKVEDEDSLERCDGDTEEADWEVLSDTDSVWTVESFSADKTFKEALVMKKHDQDGQFWIYVTPTPETPIVTSPNNRIENMKEFKEASHDYGEEQPHHLNDFMHDDNSIYESVKNGRGGKKSRRFTGEPKQKAGNKNKGGSVKSNGRHWKSEHDRSGKLNVRRRDKQRSKRTCQKMICVAAAC